MLRRTVRAAARRSRIASSDLGLGLEHLVAQRVLQRLAREPDQPEPVQVVEVGGHAVDVPAAGLGADHRQARARPARRRSSGSVPARTSTAGCGPSIAEQPQDARLVGRQLVEDPLVGRVGVLVVAHVGRAAQQLLAALAQRRRRGSAARRRRRARPPSPRLGVAELPRARRGSADAGAVGASATATRARRRAIRSAVASAQPQASPAHRDGSRDARVVAGSLIRHSEDRQVDAGRRRSPARRRGATSSHSSSRIAERSISAKSRGGISRMRSAMSVADRRALARG